MKYSEILEIENALKRLGEERLKCWYDVAKNIGIVSKISRQVGELVEAARQRFAKKDEAGQVVYTPIGGGLMRPEFATPEDQKEFDEVLKKINDDEYEVTFHKFPMSRLGDRELQGSIISPLLGVVILEEEEKK